MKTHSPQELLEVQGLGGTPRDESKLKPETRERIAAGRARFTIAIPPADDELGRWLEEHGGQIRMSCQLGTWHVSVTFGKLLSYDDVNGSHREARDVSRYHRDPLIAFRKAVDAAMAIADGRTPEP